MTKRSSGASRGRARFATGTIGATVATVLLTLLGMTASASAGALSASDGQCLTCHSMPGLEKPLADGGTLPLHIEGDNFSQSVHSAIGCTGCHADVNLASHPPAANTISNRRDFSIAMIRICRNCHTGESDQWGGSVHAALVRQGNPAAPLCTTCHTPHAVMKGAAEAMDTVPCKICHADIFTAYASSVHGMLRGAGVTQAPLCYGCHGAHGVKVPTAGQGLKGTCLTCHTNALAAHQTWLPNAALHFDVVSCPACHSPQAHRKVDLVLYNSTAKTEASEPVGVPEFAGGTGSPAAARPGLDPVTLFTLLRTLNRPGIEDKTSLKGRLDVTTGVEAHRLVPAAAAISDCNTCHQAGAAAFQSVTISVAGPSGIPVAYSANKEVLNSAFSIDSIGGFYAIGGTRIGLLDVLFVLALLGGIGGPIAHFTVRWFFRRYLNHTPHAPTKG